MKVAVAYNKTFISGHLKGLTVPATITYPTMELAARQAVFLGTGPTLTEALTGSQYTVHDVRVIE